MENSNIFCLILIITSILISSDVHVNACTGGSVHGGSGGGGLSGKGGQGGNAYGGGGGGGFGGGGGGGGVNSVGGGVHTTIYIRRDEIGRGGRRKDTSTRRGGGTVKQVPWYGGKEVGFDSDEGVEENYVYQVHQVPVLANNQRDS